MRIRRRALHFIVYKTFVRVAYFSSLLAAQTKPCAGTAVFWKKESERAWAAWEMRVKKATHLLLRSSGRLLTHTIKIAPSRIGCVFMPLLPSTHTSDITQRAPFVCVWVITHFMFRFSFNIFCCFVSFDFSVSIYVFFSLSLSSRVAYTFRGFSCLTFASLITNVNEQASDWNERRIVYGTFAQQAVNLRYIAFYKNSI